MKRDEARTLARSLMDAAGLADWRFRFDHAQPRAGAGPPSPPTNPPSGPLPHPYEAEPQPGVLPPENPHPPLRPPPLPSSLHESNRV